VLHFISFPRRQNKRIAPPQQQPAAAALGIWKKELSISTDALFRNGSLKVTPAALGSTSASLQFQLASYAQGLHSNDRLCFLCGRK
jgi:hypothetical protein